jgi:hypothetical protein
MTHPPSAKSRSLRWLTALLLVVTLVGPPTVFAQANAAEAAIQDTIQRGNAAQAQAIAAGDPTLLDDPANPYSQRLVQTNRRLLTNGVIAIELVNIEWGPIAVSGATATATATETWRTSFSDGPTSFSRDRNVYTLALDDAGVWHIVGNEQPDGRAPRNANPAPEPSDTPPPDVQPGPGTSRNWSGYAATRGTFTSVAGRWIVPTVALDSPFGADAAWVGIGGFRSRDLIQAGTQQSVSGSGTVTYQAWVEMLPDFSRPVPLTVLPGDSVGVSIDQQAGNQWLISISNYTSGKTLTRTVEYESSLSSAEWIQEAPFARRRVLPLTQFGSLDFTEASAVRDGVSLTASDLEARSITLVDMAGRALAVPSPLGSDGSSFTVSRV